MIIASKNNCELNDNLKTRTIHGQEIKRNPQEKTQNHEKYRTKTQE